MFQPNVAEIEKFITADSRVLDVGGWYQPFTRADVVVDLLDYDSRGLGGRAGSGRERFSANSWVIHDISSGPLPFDDGEFDFVVCSHTLEDVRDPVYVCSELMRVGRRGYIEVPSRAVESMRGLEGRNYVGHYHHRWLIEISRGAVSFRFKPHCIHEDRRYHLPARALRSLTPEDRVQFLFWDGAFDAREVIQVSHLQTRRELAQFAAHHAPLTVGDRLCLVVGGALTGLRDKSWKPVLHPITTHVRDDPNDTFWGDLREIDGTAAPGSRPSA